ncbi:hypothetical protein A9Q83_16325 [Alphaproteobacteria bacterium 46_93_T64]|nr:hypothetical protein A9Q83_16325 [Alphaproteobacteria bacterium 46_93_T64]
MTNTSTGPNSLYSDLQDKGIFISGGATGIGRDLVISFRQQGAHVLFVDINKAAGIALCQELSDTTDGSTTFVEADVTNDNDLESAIRETNELGSGLYSVINNAAYDLRHKFEDITPEIFASTVDVNLRHQLKAAQVGYELMRSRNEGSIINFGSVAPKMGTKDLDVYGACKMGVHGLTRSMARTMGPHNIRVNTLVPGCILTPRQLELWISPEDEKNIRSLQCLDRRLIGKDVAELALFLASNSSSACTAQEFVVDGGIT